MARSNSRAVPADLGRPGSERAEFELGPVRVTVTLDAGPRVVGYRSDGHPNLFAELPNASIDHPSIGTFWFIGGHRLWRAPEFPEITYQLDEQSIEVHQVDDSLSLVGAPDADGVVKEMSLEQLGELTLVDHRLRNDGPRAVYTAAWAITQLSTGGVAILPQDRAADVHSLLPNRTLTLWPYTDLTDPGATLGRHEVRVSVDGTSAKWKVGQANRDGWLAYVVDDSLFVKWSPQHDDSGTYPHLGASVECYRDHRFLELESLSPMQDLQPGDEIVHREIWTMLQVEGELDEVLASLPVDPLDEGV